MTLSARLEVLISMVETGVPPLFHTDDADRASRITGARREGEARAIEFTDRVVAAAADAKSKVEVQLQSKMQELTGGLPLPPGLKLF